MERLETPGAPELPTDAETVRTLVAEQWPDLAGMSVVSFGAGWDNALYLVGDEWIFRFPKRVDRVPWLLREITLNRIVSSVLGTTVAPFERIGRASAGYPYPFVGYRRLVGVGADEAPGSDRRLLAGDVGRWLSALHGIDASEIPPTPAGWEHEPWAHLRADLCAVSDGLGAILPPDVQRAALPYLRGEVREPDQDGPLRFIHNDICPDHLIVDSTTSRLVGVIDFADALVGEVVLDFVGLIGLGGYPFISEVVAHYGRTVGPGFEDKLAWLSRTLSLTWLAEAAVSTPQEIPKHLEWVRLAFEPRVW